MRKYIAVIKKELLQLIRDWPGLAILFIMPAIMLIVITLTQERVLSGRDLGMKIILVNEDSSVLGARIEQAIKSQEDFDFYLSNSKIEAEEEVFNGKAQVMLVIPENATKKLQKAALSSTPDTTGDMKNSTILPGVVLKYDPAMMRIYKEMLVASLRMIIESSAINLYAEIQSSNIEANVQQQMNDYKKSLLEIDLAKEMPELPNKELIMQAIQQGIKNKAEALESTQSQFKMNMIKPEEVVSIDYSTAGGDNAIRKPNLVDNNVPAFILFAMFFIVIPLAGSLINEKQQGTHDRIMTLPVSSLVLFSGKIIVYLAVCSIQFLVMLSIGIFIFPLISQLLPISLNVNIVSLILLVITSSLAAIGFGLLIGTITNTYGQAAPLGSVLVVILAVLGGIFSPSYMMPDALQKISIISPMRWGTDAFYSIFARNAGLKVIIPQLLLLFTFFAVSLFFATRIFTKRK